MKQIQKIIKYLALAFGIFLTINIIYIILSGIIFGVNILTPFKTLTNETSINQIISYEKSKKIEEIKVELGISKFNIRKGDEFRLETINTNENFSFKLEDNILKIKEKKAYNIYQKNKNSTVNIYIPENQKFKKVNIKKSLRRNEYRNFEI